VGVRRVEYRTEKGDHGGIRVREKETLPKIYEKFENAIHRNLAEIQDVRKSETTC